VPSRQTNTTAVVDVRLVLPIFALPQGWQDKLTAVVDVPPNNPKTIYARGGVGRSWMIIQLMPKRSRS
jgi:hypothetical protein